jgi:hypothetical protein
MSGPIITTIGDRGPGLTREEALAELRRLAVGLDPDLAGVRRLMERVAGSDEAEVLRSLLVEVGAERLLDENWRR